MKTEKEIVKKKEIPRLSVAGNTPIVYQFRQFVKIKGMRLNYILKLALIDVMNKYK